MTEKTTGEGLPVPGPGRDSLYDDSMNAMARKLALLGLNDEEMAGFFGIHVSTYYRWQNENPAFREAVNDGKTIADANVAESLYKRATGEHVHVEKVYTNRQTGEKATIKVLTYIPGESGAALNWLKNRQRRRWKDSTEVEHTGEVVHNIRRQIVRPNANDPDR